MTQDKPAVEWFAALIAHERAEGADEAALQNVNEICRARCRSDISSADIAQEVTAVFLEKIRHNENFRENIEQRIEAGEEAYCYRAILNAISDATAKVSTNSQQGFLRARDAVMKGLERGLEREDLRKLTSSSQKCARTDHLIHADAKGTEELATPHEILQTACGIVSEMKPGWTALAIETLRLLKKPVIVEQLIDALYQAMPGVSEVYVDADQGAEDIAYEDPYGEYGLAEEMEEATADFIEGLNEREKDYVSKRLGDPDRTDSDIALELGLSASTIHRTLAGVKQKLTDAYRMGEWEGNSEMRELFLHITRDRLQ